MDARFAPFEERMRAEGLPDLAIRTFQHYYARLTRGESGLLPESAIRPVDDLPDAESFGAERERAGQKALPRTVMLKLNGGLGTSMGLSRAKSLLEVKDRHTILDLIANQALVAGSPLVLMNSFNTRDDSLAALKKYPGLWERELDLDFLQHKVPKINRADYTPAAWPADPELEWCPPGHGDIYTALVTSGMLERMLAGGYRYLFVSNCDNLGAGLDVKILGYFAAERLPFMMEVAERTEMDQKGGHIARDLAGQLILREGAQTPPEDQAAFQDITRHRYFNANTLWINLLELETLLRRTGNLIELPLIQNIKPIDPPNPDSPKIIQLETAMGAAISVFPGAQALRVPRSRLIPVKTTGDLLAARSDAFVLNPDFRLALHPKRVMERPVVDLDGAYYGLIADLEARFPAGAPSLIDCERFEVRGDVRFGAGVVLRGVVRVINPGERQAVVENVTLDDRELVV